MTNNFARAIVPRGRRGCTVTNNSTEATPTIIILALGYWGVGSQEHNNSARVGTIRYVHRPEVETIIGAGNAKPAPRTYMYDTGMRPNIMIGGKPLRQIINATAMY